MQTEIDNIIMQINEYYDDDFDMDAYEGDDDVRTTVTIDINKFFEKCFGAKNENSNGSGSLLSNVLRYIDNIFANNGFDVKNGQYELDTSFKWRALYNMETYEEIPEDFIDYLSSFFAPKKQVYIPVGKIMPSREWMNKLHITVRGGKANITYLLKYLEDCIINGMLDNYMYFEFDDLEEIARETIEDREDYERSREEAADHWYHG